MALAVERLGRREETAPTLFPRPRRGHVALSSAAPHGARPHSGAACPVRTEAPSGNTNPRNASPFYSGSVPASSYFHAVIAVHPQTTRGKKPIGVRVADKLTPLYGGRVPAWSYPATTSTANSSAAAKDPRKAGAGFHFPRATAESLHLLVSEARSTQDVSTSGMPGPVIPSRMLSAALRLPLPTAPVVHGARAKRGAESGRPHARAQEEGLWLAAAR